MKVTEQTRKVLASRRQARQLRAQWYRRHETDWEIHRGYLAGKKIIIDVIISTDGLYVYTLLGDKPE